MSEKKIRVLLADDAPFHITLQKNVLENKGFEICGEAADGKQAVELYKKLQPDVLILDIIMPPNIDGLEALRQIKAEYPEAKIVMFTAKITESYVIEALKKGACDFIAKPFKEEMYVTKILIAADINRKSVILDEKTFDEWYSKQKKYNPATNLLQEEINKIINSFNEFCATINA
jgi:two-component system chemotaxis response regulator CheY